jgi:hypothetical protein
MQLPGQTSAERFRANRTPDPAIIAAQTGQKMPPGKRQAVLF